MKTICAWCNEHIKGHSDSKNVSHGICNPCSQKFRMDLGKQVLEAYLKGRGDEEKEGNARAQIIMDKLGI